jgi:hypothetical protein
MTLADDLKVGMRLALPFKRTATIEEVKVGRTFVNLKTEHGRSRLARGEEVLTEVADEHLDADGCCECGSTEHVCQDCPVFGGPE